MQITNDVSQAVAATAATSSPTTSSTSTSTNSASTGGGMVSEQTFLQLLVAQIQNQDPLSPTDSMDFVTQLAQFSSLEQLIGINQGVGTLNSDLTSAGATNSSGTTPTNPATGR